MFGELQQFTKLFLTIFTIFHNIFYAKRLQFAKYLSAKFPTVLIRQTILPSNYAICYSNAVINSHCMICTVIKYTVQQFIQPTHSHVLK